MLLLSVTIIARNEADRIGDAIRSVAFADEIVVLDSGSADGTVQVARALGARVIETDWPGHVVQKNRALAEATHDWVLSIDADERVDERLAAALAELRRSGPGDRVGYRIGRRTWWMGKPMRFGAWSPDARVRLFHRGRGRWGGENPHDKVMVDGPVGRLPGLLLHHAYRDVGEHLDTIDRYSAIAAREALERGCRGAWWDLACRPLLHFIKAYLLKMGFRDGARGLCVAVLGAAHVLLKWTRIYLGARGGPQP